MLLAEAAVFVHLHTVRVIFLVLHGIVVALLAIAAGQRNFDALVRCHLLSLPPDEISSSQPKPPTGASLITLSQYGHPVNTPRAPRRAVLVVFL
jgi:hypothetical protein